MRGRVALLPAPWLLALRLGEHMEEIDWSCTLARVSAAGQHAEGQAAPVNFACVADVASATLCRLLTAMRAAKVISGREGLFVAGVGWALRSASLPQGLRAWEAVGACKGTAAVGVLCTRESR